MELVFEYAGDLGAPAAVVTAWAVAAAPGVSSVPVRASRIRRSG
jgi:hypothetical protein